MSRNASLIKMSPITRPENKSIYVPGIANVCLPSPPHATRPPHSFLCSRNEQVSERFQPLSPPAVTASFLPGSTIDLFGKFKETQIPRGESELSH